MKQPLPIKGWMNYKPSTFIHCNIICPLQTGSPATCNNLVPKEKIRTQEDKYCMICLLWEVKNSWTISPTTSWWCCLGKWCSLALEEIHQSLCRLWEVIAWPHFQLILSASYLPLKMSSLNFLFLPHTHHPSPHTFMDANLLKPEA